jgi:hypothetical protein
MEVLVKDGGHKMAGYSQLKIAGMATGLVQSREDFLLPDDAYPILENAFVFRERIVRKPGYQLLGRLRRVLTAEPFGVTGASPWTFTIYSQLTTPITGQPNAQIQPGSVIITIAGPIVFTDQGDGTLTSATPGNSGVIIYATGEVTLTHTAGAGIAVTITFNYYPGLPVMGLRSRELNNINNEQLVAFDQVYAYIFSAGTGQFQEFIPGTTWTGNDSDFFWSTNYWVGDGPLKIFWVTNFSGTGGDPIRFTNGTAWVNFSPQINVAGDTLNQCLVLLPFRGRLVAFNTLEGPNLAGSTPFTNRIRWAAIGTPFTTAVPGIVTTGINVNAWRDDIRGQGGFLDIPTSEDIISVGFVRDNLVIYCERSTWQLRYTGRSIAPFQIEKVNSELGSESTFSAVQFDTSLVGIGDKGVVECDSFKSNRIDIKIPDLVFRFNNNNNGTKRVHGIRDFQQRIAYWTYPLAENNSTYPDRRLVYNYENDSWAIFTDSFTTLGTHQPQSAKRWVDYPPPDKNNLWKSLEFPWINRPALFPAIVGGNQQGFVEFLGQINFEFQVGNDESLFIKNITGNVTTATSIESPSHNLQTGQVIIISGIPTGTAFDNLNGEIFGVTRTDANNFTLYKYSSQSGQFSDPQLDPNDAYIGIGVIAIRDNFRIVSKKFNFLDQGNNIQIGYIDILMASTSDGAITLNVYVDYNDDSPINTLPQNINPATSLPDTFFNSVVPTSASALNGVTGSKYWQRVFCPCRGNFLTIVWTFSNLQLNGVEQENDVQIDAQVLWMRQAGRMTQT